ncbi:MAG: hypothetical protein A2W25_02700 [candidate division Zixibacteria bacterium RBG_16_53_22]|nr:MAG: hypothetical protein A2W25_02700 [candidate division Zixibacteria bacterium RBG_16_53_22]
MNQFNPKIGFVKYASLIVISALLVLSCDNRDATTSPSIDREAPPVPTGVTTTTLDGAVIVSWSPIYLDAGYNDLNGFRIYRSLNNQDFTQIGTVNADVYQYLDDGLQNGTTYYYAVSSFDFNGNESDLSYDSAYDTPRPEGGNYIYTYTDIIYQNESGFDLSTANRLPWDHTECDFYLEYDADPNVRAYFLWLGDNGAFIQDMGYTDSFDDITYAPSQGWSNFAYLEAILGHTYVLQTTNDHYAKIRITGEFLSPARGMEFDWGYQVDSGNRELKIDPSNIQSGLSAEVQ